MKLKIKLSIIVIGIVAVIVTGIALLLLREATKISINLSMENLTHMLERETAYWKGREDGHVRALNTLGAIMEDYENIPAQDRRNQFDNMLRGALLENDSWILTYSIWKPDALDNMDAQYIGRSGSSPTGQYAMTVTKETGSITTRASTDIENTMAHLNGPDAKKDRFDNPAARNINGRNTFVLIVQVPIINPRTGDVVGTVGALLDIAVIQPELERILKASDDIVLMIMYSSNGFILGHFIPGRVGKMMLDVDVEIGSNRPAMFEAIQKGEKFNGQAYDPGLGTNIIFNMDSFRLANSDQTWSILIGSAESHVLKDVTSITRFTVILAILAVLIGAVITYFALHYMTKPVVSVTLTLKDIAEGDADLTHAIVCKSRDEVGDLVKYFNEILRQIRELVIHIRNEASGLSEIGDGLSADMNETAAAINEITTNIQSIKSRIINQSASVSETHATMDQVVENIRRLNGHVENQSHNIAIASSSIEQMVANTRSVTETLVRNSDNVNALREASEVGRAGLQEVSSDIQEIARESEGLLEINSVMQNIASQTNLLSMNAAIEAAHAGEVGKGFAVVADEIRKLAENSNAQSKTIGSVLKKIKESIDKITHSTENVLNKFEAIDSSVNVVVQQEENIRSAMEEQEVGSKQILQGIANVNEITGQVTSGSQEMLTGSKEVIRESEALERQTQEIASGIHEMAEGAAHINIAVNHVNDLSAKNRENIILLQNEVARFKVE